MAETEIENVSDTSLWIAACRAQETLRNDALFHDPLAARLAGEKGQTIAASVEAAQYTAWTVAIRTCIIDAFVHQLVEEGTETILNLGAGLDTRPYRLELPASLRWIEVDYPDVIAYKQGLLDGSAPHCQLQRVGLDLSDSRRRTQFFADMFTASSNVTVLTEGVLLYLKAEQVASLAADMRGYPCFRFWIADFYVSEMIRIMRIGMRFRRSMKNAPAQFYPNDWFTFFRQHGWTAREKRYYTDESKCLGRTIPSLRFGRLIRLILPPGKRAALDRFGGYAVYEPTI